MPFIDDREVSEEEYQAALREAASHDVKDDRIIYLAVRYRGEAGAYVEGGFNTDFDWLDNHKKRAVLSMAMEALVANSVAMFPEDAEMKEFLDAQTALGESGGSSGGLRWGHVPPAQADEPPFKGGTHGDHDQAAGDDRTGEPPGAHSGDGAGREGGESHQGD